MNNDVPLMNPDKTALRSVEELKDVLDVVKNVDRQYTNFLSSVQNLQLQAPEQFLAQVRNNQARNRQNMDMLAITIGRKVADVMLTMVDDPPANGVILPPLDPMIA